MPVITMLKSKHRIILSKGRKKHVKKRIKLLAVLMCLAMALSGCAPIASNSGNSEEKGVYVLYTSDVHCGVEDGFGYAGLYAIRKSLED